MKYDEYWSRRLNRSMWKFTGHFPHYGRRTRINFTSKKDAMAAANSLFQDGQRRVYGITPPDSPRVTVKQIIEKRKSRIRPQAQRLLLRWLRTLPTGILVTELDSTHFRTYADDRLKDIKPQTVFRELTDVFAMLNSAHLDFPALKNWKPPERPKLEAMPEGDREAYYSPEQVRMLLAWLLRPREPKEQTSAYLARLDCADWFVLALMTGMRSSELRTRRWSDINFHWRTIRIDRTKGRKQGTIKVSPACIAILMKRKETHSLPRGGTDENRPLQQAVSDYVFPSPRDPSRPLKRFWTEILKRACEACGIPWGYDDPAGVVLHTTRHSTVTTMLELGHSMEAARALTGHTKKRMTERYSHASQMARDKAPEALDVFAEAYNSLSGLLSTFNPAPAVTAAIAAIPETVKKRKQRRNG